MVGLCDIPIVGDALNKISDYTVEAATRGLRYIICYKRFINDLNSEIEKVEIQETRVARKIDDAKNDGMIFDNLIFDHVMKWQREVEIFKTQASELSRQTTSTTCFKAVHLPNPVSRFRLGRKAAHLANTATKHIDFGENFVDNVTAHLAPDENLPHPDTSYQSFDSRQEAYDKLWNALVNENGHPIIGIHGMPGVGKTRMMERAWEELKEKKIFDKVTRANVGQKLDVLRLQHELSGYLKCHLQSQDNVDQRADQLKRSLLTDGQKVLVILDDVWDFIPLSKIGIPFGDGTSKGCKILLTSREVAVCRRNKCTDPIQIRTLNDEESWEMFMNTVGSSDINSLQDLSLAEEVCKECGGLPLLIGSVGSALKGSTEDIWKDALYRLQNSEFQKIEGVHSKVYAGIKFSFDKLNEDDKACLLLCSFFLEDANIDINMLFDMATGSQLLDSGRNIVGLVNSLKSSSLLLEGKNNASVKVHDVIRDVARSIATSDPNYAFLSVRCRSRLLDNDEYPTTKLLHLDLEEEEVAFPDDLDCPRVHTLWMQVQSYRHSPRLSSEFFNAFKNLKVLLLIGTFLFDNELKIHNLKKLRVLILQGCNISQTFLSSVSRNLEILCIQHCDLPSPVDIPELKDLRKLEIIRYLRKIEIVEKAISRLSRLEELIVPWGFKNDDASICWEVSQLGCLTNLVIELKKWWHYPAERDIFSSLVYFDIHVGLFDVPHLLSDPKRKKVRFRGMHKEGWWMTLVERAEEVRLEDISGMPINGFSESNMEEAFGKLKELSIEECNEMEHVASWWEKGRNQRRLQCFRNLSVLSISGCSGLKYVFSYSVAKCLLQLQTLEVTKCKSIKEIIRVEEESINDDDIIRFPNLRTLNLEDLRSLRSFCRKKVTCPNLTHLKGNIDCSSLSEEIVKDEMDDDDDDSTYHLNTPPISLLHLQRLTLSYLPNLRNIGISAWHTPELDYVFITECGLNTSLFTRSAFTDLQHLCHLEVSDCSLLEEIVKDEMDDDAYDHNTPISLLHLETLTLSNLPNLLNIGISAWHTPELVRLILSNLPNLQNIGISAWHMPKLDNVDVNGCRLITSLFTRSAFTNLQHLSFLALSDCSLLEEIVKDEMDDDDDSTNDHNTPISLLHLETLSLSNLPNLQNIGISVWHTPELVYVDVKGCGLITSLFTRSAFTDLQHLWQLEVSDCSLLEEIVKDEIDDDDASTYDLNTPPISLLHLETLTLSNLPNLRNIGISAWHTPKFAFVDVKGCGLITSLFMRSAFANLQHLRELQVSDCSLLEEIVKDEMDDATPGMTQNMISLPLLTYIKLQNLPRIRSFSSSSTFTFNFPALRDISLSNCPGWRYSHPSNQGMIYEVEDE